MKNNQFNTLIIMAGIIIGVNIASAVWLSSICTVLIDIRDILIQGM